MHGPSSATGAPSADATRLQPVQCQTRDCCATRQSRTRRHPTIAASTLTPALSISRIPHTLSKPFIKRYSSPHTQPSRMDDLLDLSWSDKPASGSSTSGGAKPPSGAGAFDFLSKPANPSAPNYSGRSTPLVPSPRPGSAARLQGRNGTNGTSTPAMGSGQRTPAMGASAPKPAIGGDAFSDLLGGSSSPASSGKNLSMAERAAKLAAEKAEKERREREQWGGFLDGFDAPKPASPAPVKPSSPAPSHPMLAPKPQPAVARTASPLSARTSPSPSSTTSAPKAGSFWDSDMAKSATPANDDHDDLDDFLGGSSKPTQVNPTGGDLLGGTTGSGSKSSGPSDPWDLDALAASVPSASDKPAEERNDRPSDFDYGNDFAEDDDDLLGGLGSTSAVSSSAPLELTSSAANLVEKPPRGKEPPRLHPISSVRSWRWVSRPLRPALLWLPRRRVWTSRLRSSRSSEEVVAVVGTRNWRWTTSVLPVRCRRARSARLSGEPGMRPAALVLHATLCADRPSRRTSTATSVISRLIRLSA